jgi:dTDP-4-dehydrorhamnose reductase
MYSGLPTVVLAQIVRDIVIKRTDLFGVYHIASQPISKYDLLKLIAEVYGKTIEVIPSDKLVIDRALNADRFRDATGYVAPSWPELIKMMHKYK